MRNSIGQQGLSKSVISGFLCVGILAFVGTAGAETFIQDGQGYWWDFAADGSVVDGRGPAQAADSVDGFDNGMRLSVGGQTFTDAAQTTSLGGRMISTGPLPLAGLQVTRRAYVSNDSASSWTCFLEYLENTGDTGIAVSVRVFGNLGSDGNTTVTGSSSGDTAFTAADRWVTSNDGVDNHDPDLSFNYWGAGAAVMPDAVLLPASQEDYFVQYPNVAVPPHSTVILMHFCSQNPGPAEAISQAQTLDGLPPASLVGLNAANFGPVLNWAIEDALEVTPHALAVCEGFQAGPFAPLSHSYTLSNVGATAIDWNASGPAWLTVTPSSGTGLAASGSVPVQVALNPAADSLLPGTYTEAVVFGNLSSGAQIVRNVKLIVNERLELGSTAAIHFSGFQGGPFAPSVASCNLTNLGGDTLVWTVTGPAWLDVSPFAGMLAASESVPVAFTPNAGAAALPPGLHSGVLTVQNDSYGTVQTIAVDIQVNEQLAVSPAACFVSRGRVGGPFVPTAGSCILHNTSTDLAVDWSIAPGGNPVWLNITPASGTLAAGASITISFEVDAATAAGLPAGDYDDPITFTNDTFGSSVDKEVLLRVKDIVHVDRSAAGPVHDGSTWASAFTTIQAGIDAAVPTRSWVWVADGVYPETIVMADGVEVYGGFGGESAGETAMAQRDPAGHVAVIDGGGAGSVVRFEAIADAGLDGFTIQNGAATGVYPENSGGGIRCNGTDVSVFIAQCVIRNNRAAQRGAGILCMAEAAPLISECLIAGNETDTDFGGGIACVNAAPIIMDSRICNNHGRFGGGIGCIQCSPTVINCVIAGNVAASAAGGAGGGGVFAHDHSSPVLVNCVLSGNAARDWGGGALFCQTASNAVLTNCTISGNACNTGGGGIQAIAGSPVNPGSEVVLTNCVLERMNQYALWLDAQSDAEISHCQFYANAGADIFQDSGVRLTGGDVINAGFPDAHDNVAGNPATRVKPGQEGVWTAVNYNPADNTTALAAAGSAWVPDALAGQLLAPDAAQTRQALILSNTADTIFVAGDITAASGLLGCAAAGGHFQTISYEMQGDSPCIDVGDNTAPQLPGVDLAGNPRIVRSVVDLGAYESAGVASASVLDIVREGNPAEGGAVLCFLVTFSRAVENLSTTDFAVDGLEGQVAASIENVTGNDYRWRVCIRTGAVNGRLAVDLVDDDLSIADILGYPLDAGYDADPLSPTGSYYVDHLAITLPPEDAAKLTGEAHTFLVEAANGTGTLHYRWLKDTVPIPGGPDLNELALANLRVEDSGLYACEVSDDYLTITSDDAELAVTPTTPASGIAALGLLVAGFALLSAWRITRGARAASGQ